MSRFQEHLYVVVYDIRDDRRWRRVFRTMKGFGDWVQLSVFQCRLSRSRAVDLAARLEAAIAIAEDHVMIIDVGIAEGCEPRVRSLGKQTFEVIERKPVIV